MGVAGSVQPKSMKKMASEGCWHQKYCYLYSCAHFITRGKYLHKSLDMGNIPTILFA